MPWTTIILAIFLLLGMFHGRKNGLITEGLTLIGYLVGYFLAERWVSPLTHRVAIWTLKTHWAQSFTVFLTHHLPFHLSLLTISTNLFHPVIFLLCILLTALVGHILGIILTDILTPLRILEKLNHLGGTLLGLIKNWVILGVVFSFILTTPLLMPRTFVTTRDHNPLVTLPMQTLHPLMHTTTAFLDHHKNLKIPPLTHE